MTYIIMHRATYVLYIHKHTYICISDPASTCALATNRLLRKVELPLAVHGEEGAESWLCETVDSYMCLPKL